MMSPNYAIILFDSERHVSEQLIVTCPDDINAFEKARRRAKGRAAEIWRGDKLLTEIRPDGQADLEALHLKQYPPRGRVRARPG